MGLTLIIHQALLVIYDKITKDVFHHPQSSNMFHRVLTVKELKVVCVLPVLLPKCIVAT